jgi:Na+-driven multidrug efflux pump
MSPFLMNACACLVVLLLNRSMQKYGGDDALAAYGIVNSVGFVFIMIVMGLNQGMQPIAGYNWGAHKNDRVWQVLRYTMVAGTVVTTIGFLLGMLAPELPAKVFTNDKTIISMAAHGFRICVLIFPLVGGQIVVSHFFQSIGHAGKSIFLSLSRQLIFLIPGMLILPNFFGLDGVWYSLPFADTMSCIIAATLLWWQVRHISSKEEREA